MRARRMSAVSRGGGNRFEPVVGRRVRRAAKAVLALLAAMAMLAPGSAFAAVGDQPAVEFNRLADEDTSRKYDESLGDNNSTRYAGRVWNDKTVSSGDMTFKGQLSGGSETVEKGSSDFLVTYSVLATSQQVTKLPKVPVDVVFVLDFSASMTWGVDNREVAANQTDSRIYAMVEALNRTVNSLKKDSDSEHPNRIGIAYFNRVGYTLLPLTELSDDNLSHVHDRDNDGIPEYLQVTRFDGERGTDVTCYVGNEVKVATTDSKTNIQYGLYEGMNMLADAQTTTFEYEKDEYTRIPNVVLMSDGAPTTISDASTGAEGEGTQSNPRTGNWWKGLDNNGDESIGWGDNERAWSANGMMPMLTAQYMKNKINSRYRTNAAGLPNADQADASMYTIGFGINEQTESMVQLANMVLNPQENWDPSQYEWDSQHRQIIREWGRYVDGDPASLQYVTEGNRTRRYYRAGHPEDTDANDPGTPVPDYVDQYFSANNADELEDAFREITNAITETAKVPTETTGNPVRSGYITYTDPIGEYMHVDDVKTLIYANQRFDRTGTPVKNETTTKYVFTGIVNSPVYGDHNVSEIEITVTSEIDGTETLTVKIPASVIPIRVNEVDVKVDGTVVRNDSNNAYPLRLVYGVSLKDNVVENGVVNTNVVSRDYINKHSSGDGTVRFYTNWYSGDKRTGADGSQTTVGDANVIFEPADDNPFYYVQENIPLYVGDKIEDDGTLTGKQIAKDELDANKTYYFQINYYEGKEMVARWVSRPGSQLERLEGSVAPTGIDGQLELQTGSPRLGNLTDLSRAKGQNATGTAAQRLYPTFEPAAGTSDPADGSFCIYLGNNGVLSVPTTQPVTIEAGQALAVVKRLHGNDLSANEADDNNFKFTLTPQATTSADDTTAVTADEAAEKLKRSDTTDGGTADGILHFRNGDATKDDDGVATDTMHPITVGLTFTAADAGKTFTYEVAEVVPDPKPAGYIFDTTLMHTVTYTVALSNDGQLTVTASVDGDAGTELPATGGNQVPTVAFDNTYVAPVSALPLTGGDATARNLILAGGGILLLAGVAWLLARRRRV